MRALRARYSNHQVDEENPYWISFSDIMAGLLVIFMLAAIVFIMELMQKSEELMQKSEQWDEAIEELAKAEKVRKNIITEVVRELNEKNIPVRISENDTVITIPEDVLTFKSRQFEIPRDEQLQSIVMEIGRVLYSTITKEERWQYLDTIFIEGHTDRIPYSNTALKGNWGLSTFRAISVWTFWNANMPEGARLEQLRNHNDDNLFSVSGYAETRPAPCTNEDPNIDDVSICPSGPLEEQVSLRKNRRIDIRFTVKRPQLEDYVAVKRTLK